MSNGSDKKRILGSGAFGVGVEFSLYPGSIWEVVAQKVRSTVEKIQIRY